MNKKQFRPFFLYPKPRKKMLEDWKKGEAPDHFLWGLNYLVGKNHENYFSDMAFSRFNFLLWLFLPLQKWLIKRTGTGFKIDQAFLLLPKLRKVDVIVAVGDSVALPIAFLKKLGSLKTPLIHISMGLAGKLERKKTDKKTAALLNKVIGVTEKIIFLSKLEKDLALKWFKFKKGQVSLFDFGVDVDFFTRVKKKLRKKDFILSLGRDESRDYQTLFKAAQKITKQKFIVVTSKRNVSNLTAPSNVEIIYDASYYKIRDLYWQAKIFVHPLKETYRGAGQTPLLEALICQLPVIAADTKGMQEYHFQDHNDCWFYKKSDSEDLAEKIEFLINNPQSAFKNRKKTAAFVEKHYSSQLMIKKLREQIEKIL